MLGDVVNLSRNRENSTIDFVTSHILPMDKKTLIKSMIQCVEEYANSQGIYSHGPCWFPECR